MGTTSSLPAADGGSEALSAVGLVLNVASIVAFTVCFAVFSTGSAAFAAILGAIAVAAFAASICCFFIDGNRARTRLP
ncbi:hypothetical protein [Mycobacterium sp.]|jgi:hypothetical protein|uniref:hypothetical protein n=1 Tax=Mycobacterium sp. TaxID=1785 RepID=UPI00334238F5|nr:hypothetical protein [Mycobacterium sp.]